MKALTGGYVEPQHFCVYSVLSNNSLRRIDHRKYY